MPSATPATASPGTPSKVLSLRIDAELFERLHTHAAKRGMSVQDYVVRTLIRDDFDERFRTSVDETERFYGTSA
ncbi:ribbon-helix-helix protein, CopG family [Streptomyces sp. HNM0574]|nr:ribbon-helix-helix protein, CopG family [Streptomyces sp. HNM0574]